ncbi:DUF58 domain-containing protein [Blastopirellula marina]|uniref:DUF58 domain-containing protein n=1 Tax=Blastopirellula marina DSM 3645 TaxID=314230 RepID=A3ZY65_9BACT|nr:DUF58 domain-containing protein [Blastopirellula marina]EAQ78536.1 hypothetical protein DSM3645_26674 [Blastopirellula marina DSM 3645]
MTSLAQGSRFFDRRALSALAHMRFTTAHRVEGSYSGRHKSRQQGGAGEFVDFREYSGGEDLRRLDWKLLARTGKSFVRLHQEETNLVCMLAIDASESMAFSGSKLRTGSKLEYAQFLTTALSYIISLGQDQVGLAVLKSRLEDHLSPGGTSAHVMRIMEQIEQIKTVATTQSAPGLRELFERTTQRGVLLFVSDFLMEDLDETFAALRLFRHRGLEVLTLHLIHPEEETLPQGSSFRFEEMEKGGSLSCTPDEFRDDYQRRFSAHQAMVRQMTLAAGCDYRRISTSIPYLESLGGFLMERSG